MKKHSLRKKILIINFFCFFIFFLALVLQSSNALHKNINSALEEEIILVSDVFTSAVGNWMHDRRQAVIKLAKVLEQHTEIEPHILLDQIKDSLGFSLVYYGNEQGEMYRNDPSLNPPNYDPRVRSWYIGALTEKGSFLATPFISASTKEYVVTLSEPVRSNNKIIGAVGANLTLVQLTKYANNINIPGNGYAIIVDKSDQIIAHPDIKKQSTKASDLDERFTAQQLESLVAKNSLEEMTLDNRERLVYAQSIPNSSWSLILVMDKDTLFSPVFSQLITQVAISTIILAAVLLVISILLKLMLQNLSKITKNLDDIANGDGDLTIRLEFNSGDEIGQLASSFNRFIEQLHGIISRVSDASKVLLNEAGNVSKATNQQNDRLQRHQNEILMVATASAEMASATKAIAFNAEQTAQSSQHCVSITEHGRAGVYKSQKSTKILASEVDKASEIIQDLNQHAQKITSILSTISGISEQTNLLALNAAIEAARAGEQGRGFAVVADEVRVLSQRTFTSTQEIQAMIESLQSSAKKAVDATNKGKEMASQSIEDADEASLNLGKILESVSVISDMAAQISTAAEEQSAVTLEISHNTETIRVVGDEMSEASQLAAEQAKKLHELGREIDREVGKFKL